MDITWPEIAAILENPKQKRDLRLSGKETETRIALMKGTLPSELWKCVLLTALEIYNVPPLILLSPEIQKLQQLKELTISGAKLTNIPDEIVCLNQLKILILDHNEISTIPKDIGKLKSLQTLNLNFNMLSEVPDSFCQLSELLILNLSNNKFSVIPSQISTCKRLSTMNMSGNALTFIPDFLIDFTNLSNCDFRQNQLKTLPTVLGYLNKLTEVKLEENPFEDKKFIKCLSEGKWKSVANYLKKASGNVVPVSNGKLEIEKKKIPVEILVANSKDEVQKVFVSDDVLEIRPFFCGFILRAVEFTPELFDHFIDLQTEIHQTLCKKRTLAAMGTHDMASVQTPFTYTALLPEEFSFTPLKSEVEMKGFDLEKHFKQLKDNTMLKYLAMIQVNEKWPVLLDSTKKVMSVDPVINSRYSEIKVSTKNVLVECSSSESDEICKQVCCELLVKTAKLLGKTEVDPLAIEPITICSKNGHPKFRFPSEEDLEPYFNLKSQTEKKGKKK